MLISRLLAPSLLMLCMLGARAQAVEPTRRSFLVGLFGGAVSLKFDPAKTLSNLVVEAGSVKQPIGFGTLETAILNEGYATIMQKVIDVTMAGEFETFDGLSISNWKSFVGAIPYLKLFSDHCASRTDGGCNSIESGRSFVTMAKSLELNSVRSLYQLAYPELPLDKMDNEDLINFALSTFSTEVSKGRSDMDAVRKWVFDGLRAFNSRIQTYEIISPDPASDYQSSRQQYILDHVLGHSDLTRGEVQTVKPLISHPESSPQALSAAELKAPAANLALRAQELGQAFIDCVDSLEQTVNAVERSVGTLEFVIPNRKAAVLANTPVAENFVSLEKAEPISDQSSQIQRQLDKQD